jgi:hypothetical protein
MESRPATAHPAPARWPQTLAALTTRALLRPRLAWDLFATAWAFRRRHWLTRPPFLPLPDPEYLRWRMYTAYGNEEAVPPVEDVIRFAQWRRKLLRL